MTRPIFTVASPERQGRLSLNAAVHAGTPRSTKTVWAVCVAALTGAAIVWWAAQEPAHEAVVLSSRAVSTAVVSSQGSGAPSMSQFPGLAALPAEPVVAPPPGAVSASLLALPGAQAGRMSSEGAAGAAGTTGVPVSTWVAATRGPNEVPPRSDMRYHVNTPQRH
ncbi:MAG: hypothetical protein H7224_04100 [Polaromonas sp.]|nr:hypothetical protein [Polaromonas sp.]